MAIGIVKWFNATAGYGFVIPEDESDNSPDIFVHWTEILPAAGPHPRSLVQGELVEYDVEVTERGVQGRRVRRIELISREEAAKIEALLDPDADTIPMMPAADRFPLDAADLH